MTDPVETIDCDPFHIADEPTAMPHPNRLANDGAEFLDDAWAQEFDRRLAAWEAESPSVEELLDTLNHR